MFIKKCQILIILIIYISQVSSLIIEIEINFFVMNGISKKMLYKVLYNFRKTLDFCLHSNSAHFENISLKLSIFSIFIINVYK